MSVYVFLGPTMSWSEAREELDAEFLPPASQGDVYRISRERPHAIGIVDGYFQTMPAVWHKEILWALSKGIRVFGAASMGALRAAELHRFGMQGIGVIFEAFNSGKLEDDDEVAVAHGDADTGYRPTSEAMVNIRITLAAAERKRVISARTRRLLERAAKQTFFPERSYAGLLRAAAAARVAANEVSRLRTFVDTERINQKRTDARAMLAAIREGLHVDAPEPVSFTMARTDAWEDFCDSFQWTGSRLSAEAASEPRLIAEELRLRGTRFLTMRRAALLRASASAAGRQQPFDAHVATQSIERILLRERGLTDDDDPRAWREINGLDEHEYQSFLCRDAEVRWIGLLHESEVERYLMDEVRATGDYPAVRARASEKEHLLSSRGLAKPTLLDAGLTESELFQWYFEERLGWGFCPDLDTYRGQVGLSDHDSIRRDALRELLYLRFTADGTAAEEGRGGAP